MSPLFAIAFFAILAFFIYFQVARSRDKGQRGRVLQKVADHLGCEFEVMASEDLKQRVLSFNLGSIRMARNHIRCASGSVPIDILDVRYSYSAGGSTRVSLSTVALFDYDGPAFRCAPNPDPQPSAATGERITVDNETFNRDRMLTGASSEEIRQALPPQFIQLAIQLGDSIVQSDGNRVMCYGWRRRILPDEVPGLLKDAAEVAVALGAGSQPET